MSDIGAQRRTRIRGVEPPLVPALQRRLEAKAEILLALPLAELKTGTRDWVNIADMPSRIDQLKRSAASDEPG